jgi:hypothetical protein
MTQESPGTCPVCGDDVTWCPYSPDYIPVADRTRPESEQPAYLIVCGYCDAPTFVAGPGHSVHCSRYVAAPKRQRKSA